MGKGGRGKGKSSKELRFAIGAQVVCQTDEGWQPGKVVDLWYTQCGFPRGFYAPYQVELTDGTLIFVPEDVPQLCKERVFTWWEKAFRTGHGAAPMASKVRAAAVRCLDVNEADCTGSTALGESVHNGWDLVTRVLLDMRADASKADGKGRSPLHLAAAAQFTTPQQVGSTVRALLEARADPNAQGEDPEVDPDLASSSFKECEKHRTALHYCAARDYIAAAHHLLEARADPNLTDGQHKMPLHLAIDERSSGSMVAMLLKAKSDPDKGNADIGLNSSYLMVAARTGDAALAAALINAKANANLIGKQGMTALHIAVKNRKAEVAQLLIESGCDSSLPAMGKTAGELALKNGDPGMAKMLLAEKSGDSPQNAKALDEKKRRKELHKSEAVTVH